MGSGGPSVMTSGAETMPWWSATSLATGQKVRMCYILQHTTSYEPAQ